MQEVDFVSSMRAWNIFIKHVRRGCVFGGTFHIFSNSLSSNSSNYLGFISRNSKPGERDGSRGPRNFPEMKTHVRAVALRFNSFSNTFGSFSFAAVVALLSSSLRGSGSAFLRVWRKITEPGTTWLVRKVRGPRGIPTCSRIETLRLTDCWRFALRLAFRTNTAQRLSRSLRGRAKVGVPRPCRRGPDLVVSCGFS